MTIKGKAYIAGAFEHPTRHAPDKTVAQLHAEVALGALKDAGLTRDDVDPETIQDRVNEWRESIRDALPSELVLIDINVEAVSQFTRADGLGSERVDFDDLST